MNFQTLKVIKQAIYTLRFIKLSKPYSTKRMIQRIGQISIRTHISCKKQELWSLLANVKVRITMNLCSLRLKTKKIKWSKVSWLISVKELQTSASKRGICPRVCGLELVQAPEWTQASEESRSLLLYRPQVISILPKWTETKKIEVSKDILQTIKQIRSLINANSSYLMPNFPLTCWMRALSPPGIKSAWGKTKENTCSGILCWVRATLTQTLSRILKLKTHWQMSSTKSTYLRRISIKQQSRCLIKQLGLPLFF